ncbi:MULTISPECIES: alpha,alpha-trehalose-phosphate synthase (UDP-forming) [unclassified Streptomyces]|uniref:alpha,alpha-trehalose-phosphate synthase (UDP-forming) n=1 Tax=unclassified Streptomyces TaxID=2593676 RepID=UPI002DDB6029|nr:MULTISPECIES: trehalose-6-phosphate synthase [unclassified Streptomyces]WSA78227.1 trehalose-6-phosphate synthase [Streptomyces sp. NBC_01799]WSF85313.1 trehalose-6-phosphate synthase [Streptomyces sp. NBC_01744]WSA69740.1 trehalose-6-phosphate synthase [Streptomyces sp. NBC_01800]WSC38396.1 trehalose-6-phosphate synthase [Streptomyces sp. NBC_01763]WSC46535.1 trehalose-6-phosphate synthase [Streptomyces sp. NBC_01762]
MVSEHVITSAAQVLVASNRGPVSYALSEDGSISAKRGGGGLVSGLSAVEDKLWVCAALGDGDREAVRRGIAEPGVRMLDIDADVHADAYNGIANSVLWFVHHMLYQTPLDPVFDAEFRRQWASFEAYNLAFAQALAEEAGEGAAVLVQDYHLALVPGMLRDLRPDLRIGHFSHTPWAPADYFRLLPDDIAEQLLRGMLGADRTAFLTRRWADAFTACCTEVLGGTGRTRIGVHGLGADADFLRRRAHQPDVDERMAILREQVGGTGRKTIVRVDRTELSKNIVRGLLAYRELLNTRPQWRERVVHVAFAYPSRQDLAVYREYTAEVQRLADDINEAYGTPDWTPVLLHVNDDFARSLGAYRLADVALVNPIRDGMNLVAKEVPVVSDRGCALVLSREAGAYEELGADAIVVNPYDVSATAAALHEALTMPDGERAERSKRLAAAATALPPQQWFLEQLEALRRD